MSPKALRCCQQQVTSYLWLEDRCELQLSLVLVMGMQQGSDTTSAGFPGPGDRVLPVQAFHPGSQLRSRQRAVPGAGRKPCCTSCSVTDFRQHTACRQPSALMAPTWLVHRGSAAT